MKGFTKNPSNLGHMLVGVHLPLVKQELSLEKKHFLFNPSLMPSKVVRHCFTIVMGQVCNHNTIFSNSKVLLQGVKLTHPNYHHWTFSTFKTNKESEFFETIVLCFIDSCRGVFRCLGFATWVDEMASYMILPHACHLWGELGRLR